MRKRKIITITQVAKRAGVSTQTVSRVINNRPDVAPETRDRINEIIESMGYRPSHIARSLSQGRTKTLGVVGSGIEYFGTARILVGIEDAATSLGYRLLLSLVNPPESHYVEPILRDMLSRNVDGIIWHVPQVNRNRAWICKEARQMSTPVVFISMEWDQGISVAEMDNYLGGQLATNHLVEQGYQKIGIITGPSLWWSSDQRLYGWKDALISAGREVEDRMIAVGDWTSLSGERCMEALLNQYPEMDAVFVSNDQMALGAMRTAQKRGRRIPQTLGMVGYDDIPESGFYMPSLTTVHQNLSMLGNMAVQELERLIEAGRKSEMDIQYRSILLKPELVIRESSRMFGENQKGGEAGQ